MTDAPEPRGPLPTIDVAERKPAKGQKVMCVARDHNGPYGLPFVCSFDGNDFIGPRGGRLAVDIIAWRPANPLDGKVHYKPSRTVLHTPRRVSR